MTKFHASAKGVAKPKKPKKPKKPRKHKKPKKLAKKMFKFAFSKPFEFSGSGLSPGLFEAGGVKKQVKHKWGTNALREIRRAQKETHQVIPKASLNRTVRSIAGDFMLGGKEWRFEDSAFRGAQEAAEAFAIEALEDANLVAINAGRVTVMAKDIRLAQRLKGEYTSDGMGGYK